MNSDRTPGGNVGAFGELRSFLQEFELETVLRTVALSSNWLANNRTPINTEIGAPVSRWALAFIARQALCDSAWKPNGRSFTVTDLAHAVRLYEDLPEPIYSTTPEKDPIAPERTFLRMANLQYPFQENLHHAFARMAHILDDTAPRTTRGPKMDIGHRLQEIHGMSASRIVRTGALLSALGQKMTQPAPVISLSALSRSDIPAMADALDLANLRQFVREFGLPVAARQSGYLDCGDAGDYVKYTFNELKAYPIVELSEDLICIPCLEFLLQRMSTGLYFSLSDDSNLGGKENPFREKFGYVFEEYVGEQIKAHVKGYTIHPEFLYDSGKRSPDWLLIRGKEAILIECKSSQLSVGARTYFDDRFLLPEARRVYLAGVNQLATFMAFVTSGGHVPEFLAGIERYYSIVLTFVPLYLANSVYPTLFGHDLPQFPRSHAGLQFVSIEEFEQLLGLVDRYDLVGILKRRTTARESPEEFGQFLHDEIGASRANSLIVKKVTELFGLTPPRRPW